MTSGQIGLEGQTTSGQVELEGTNDLWPDRARGSDDLWLGRARRDKRNMVAVHATAGSLFANPFCM